MTSGIDAAENLEVITAAARDAKAGGAAMLFTPEMALLLDRNRKRAGPWIKSEAPKDCARAIAQVACDEQIDIVIGSMPVAAQSGKFANRSFVFGANGAAPVTYDKIHMFDVELSTGETWRESSAYEAGGEIVTIDDTPVGRLGLAICYDMRFPALFEGLGRRLCDAIAVPAAFRCLQGRRTGTFCCAPGRLRHRPLSLPQRRLANMKTGARPMAIRWWSIRGARFCSTWAGMPRDWPFAISIWGGLPMSARKCQALPMPEKSPNKQAS